MAFFSFYLHCIIILWGSFVYKFLLTSKGRTFEGNEILPSKGRTRFDELLKVGRKKYRTATFSNLDVWKDILSYTAFVS